MFLSKSGSLWEEDTKKLRMRYRTNIANRVEKYNGLAVVAKRLKRNEWIVKQNAAGWKDRRRDQRTEEPTDEQTDKWTDCRTD